VENCYQLNEQNNDERPRRVRAVEIVFLNSWDSVAQSIICKPYSVVIGSLAIFQQAVLNTQINRGGC